MKATNAIDVKSVIRWILGLLFVWAAISKIAEPQAFFGSILNYQMPLPLVLQKTAAMMLPWLELFCGLALLAGMWVESVATTLTVMFGFFIIATGQAWLRGLDISCGCFDLTMLGISENSPVVHFIDSVRFAFFRNLVLTAMALYLVIVTVRMPAEKAAAAE